MEDLILYAALSWNDVIGPKKYIKIKERFNDLKVFFQLSIRDQMDFLGIKNNEAEKKFSDMLPEGERIFETCRKKSISMISIESSSYPQRLREIPDPPFLLYQIGIINHSIKLAAIVGTRHTSPEAAAINEYFSMELVSYGIGIVSGLAKGHDAIAQKTVVDNDGYTIAVLGCGIDVIYPKESKELYRLILKKGAILSEYPPGTLPLRQYFPIRNRIISGLSDAVLVVQAPEKSGALITAKYAEIQGKELFVIPGSPSDKRNSGSNLLIQNGAKVALTPDDIAFELLGKKAEKSKRINKRNNPISREEEFLLDRISTETYIDDIAELTNIPLPRLNHMLTGLEIRGLVIQYPGRYYVRSSE